MKSLTVVTNQQLQTFDNASIVERWIKFAQVKPASEKAYRKGFKNFLNFLQSVGVNSLVDVTRDIVIDYRSYLEQKYKSPSTRNLYISATKMFFNFLEVENVIEKNPTLRVKGFDVGKKHKKDAVKPAQNMKVINALNNVIKSTDVKTKKGKRQYLTGLRNLAIYALMATTGIRTVEVSRAVIKNLVYDEETGTAKLYVTGKGHDSADDFVNVSAEVVTLIKNYLTARVGVPADCSLTLIIDKASDDESLFGSTSNRNFGNSILPTSLSTIIKKLFIANGIKTSRISCHSLRHGFCTAALKAGASLRQVQAAMRHSKIETSTHYLHELEDEDNPASMLVTAAIGLA